MALQDQNLVLSSAQTITATAQSTNAYDILTGNTSGVTYTTYIETAAIPLASILASARLAAFDLPRRQVKSAMPRFYALDYIVAGSNFSGLTVTAYINLGGTSAQDTLGQYASNY